MRAQSRRLRIDHRIQIHQPAPLPGHERYHLSEQLQAGDIFVPLVRGGEMRPEIALSHRTEQRIANRVGQDIGIRMSIKTLAVGNLYATKHKLATGRQGMDVVADADSHAFPFRAASIASAMARSSCVVIFIFSQLPSTM